MASIADFETLVEYHSAEIFRYLWRMMGDAPDAEDCLQEAFLRAYGAYDRLKDDSNPRAWLYKIATNVALTHLKRRGRLASRTADVDPALAHDGDSVSEQVDRRLDLESVRQAVEALPHKQRASLMLRKFQGLSYAEIAAALDSSEAAVRANVYQGLKKLRTQFKTPVEPRETMR